MFLLKPVEVNEDLANKLKYPLSGFFIIPIVAAFFAAFNLTSAILFSAVAIGGFGYSFIVGDFHKILLKNTPLGYGVSFIAFLCNLVFMDTDNLLYKISLSLVILNALCLILSLFFNHLCNGKINPKNLKHVSFGAVALAFGFFIYLPSDSYINNVTTFDFTYQDFIFLMLIPFFISVVIMEAVGLLLNKKGLRVYLSLLAGLNMVLFLQYTFFNSNLKVLVGDAMDWDQFTGFSIITGILLLGFLALPFIMQVLVDKVWAKAVKKVPLFLGLVQAGTLAVLIFSTSSTIFTPSSIALSGEEQYTVSKNKNIITIFLDAADNQFVKEVLETRPQAFDGFEDFTMYTNTVSVFDSTFQSMTQIYSGITDLPVCKVADWNKKAWNSDQAVEFYNRFHNAGYKMNFFVTAGWNSPYLNDKIDNMTGSKINQSFETYSGLVRDFCRLALYRAAPFGLKRFCTVDDLNINSNFIRPDKCQFYNDDFAEKIDTMKLADNNKNYFIVEHLWGAHTPYSKGDNYIDTIEYIMGITRDYLDNLKKLGKYDDSTIIIMADHGSHNITRYPDSTPLFMIKEAGKKSDEMTLNSSPMYYTDLMATYLKSAGLYDENSQADKELFGNTIYDFAEGEQRERIANYRVYDKSYPKSNKSPLVPSFGYNVIYSYKFTGDTSDLLAATKRGPDFITHMEEDAS